MEVNMSDNCNGHHKIGDGSYWIYDARGFALARVCEQCEDKKLSKFRSDILTNSNYEMEYGEED